jgi:hypothetical protein
VGLAPPRAASPAVEGFAAARSPSLVRAVAAWGSGVVAEVLPGVLAECVADAAGDASLDSDRSNASLRIASSRRSKSAQLWRPGSGGGKVVDTGVAPLESLRRGIAWS